MDEEDVFEDAVEEQQQEQQVVIIRNETLNNNLKVVVNTQTTVRTEVVRSVSPKPKFSKKFKPKFIRKNRSKSEDIPLAEAIDEAKLSVDLFLDNRYEEARNICEPMADRSIYHALGYGVFMYLKAVMTFEQKHIEEASTVLSNAVDTINGFRKKTGIAENIGRIVRKVDYDSYTELELHAELCYAECLLLKAALTFCEDETLVSFVKAGLKVRSCYQSFRECWSALHQRNWNDSMLRADFESGVRLGVGGFNLMISLLPGRIMKLLEFIGFDGNRSGKDAGLRELMLVYDDKKGMRHFLSCFVLLGYHLLLSFFVGSESDLTLCQTMLEEKLQMYPDGAFFKFFKGRLHFVKGDISDAITWYQSSVASQNDWPQFHHICYWELYWACVLSQQWWEAIKYADLLYKESKWSKCMYAYFKAAVMCMVQGELTEKQRKEQIELMRNVPKLRQKIAGKSLPMEKFAAKKAERFLDQYNNLALPAFELIYIWNNFRVLGQHYSLVEAVYVIIEKTKKRLEENKESVKYFNDDFCLVNLLLGVCLKFMKSPLQAEECLKTVLSYSGKLTYDTYLIPYAMFEYGILLKEQGETQAAMDLLESAKNDFKDYSLLSRLHFRIHAVQTELKKIIKNSSGKKRLKGSSSTSSLSSGSRKGANNNSLEVIEDDEWVSSSEASNSFQDADDVMPFMTTETSISITKELDAFNEEAAMKVLQGKK